MARLRIRRKRPNEAEEEFLEQGTLDKNSYYYLDGVKRCYRIWNLYNPEDVIRLKNGYCIHHINEIKTDDRIENLRKMTKGAHITLHKKGSTFSNISRLRISAATQGQNNPMFGKQHTAFAKQKMSDYHSDKVLSNAHKRKIGKAVRGEKNGNAKTTEIEVVEMRRLYAIGKRICDLARLFNSTSDIVSAVVYRKSFKHLL